MGAGPTSPVLVVGGRVGGAGVDPRWRLGPVMVDGGGGADRPPRCALPSPPPEDGIMVSGGWCRTERTGRGHGGGRLFSP